MFGKNKCDSISELLWNYESNRLDPEATAKVQAHLASCSRCQKQAEQLQSTISLLSDYRRQPVPTSQSTWQQLKTRIETEKQPGNPIFSFNFTRPTLLWGSSLAAATLIVFMLNSPLKPSQHNNLPRINPTTGTTNIAATNDNTYDSLDAEDYQGTDYSGGDTSTMRPTNNKRHTGTQLASNSGAHRQTANRRPILIASNVRQTHSHGHNSKKMLSDVDINRIDGGRGSDTAGRVTDPSSVDTSRDSRDYIMDTVTDTRQVISNVAYGDSEEAHGW